MQMSKHWNARCTALAAMVIMSTLTGCSSGERRHFYTGRDYVTLQAGQSFLAPRNMTLATEAVISRKDQQILDLQKALAKTQKELDYLRSQRR